MLYGTVTEFCTPQEVPSLPLFSDPPESKWNRASRIIIVPDYVRGPTVSETMSALSSFMMFNLLY